MAENKNNIYTGLSKILNRSTNTMALSKSEIDSAGLIKPKNEFPLRFDNEEEYKKSLLKLRQQRYQDTQYSKITYDAYQKSVFYESTKYASYMDYEQMEFCAETATALSILSEESTTLFDDGTMLRIESDSERIKKILTHLFNNILQINVSLPFWTRNMCKYGDSFLYLKTEEGKGVLKALQMKNIEIKRVEGSEKSIIDDSVHFEWEGHDEKFSEFQMLHFRLISDDKKLPYGTSILDKVRKPFKQLSIAEDAMMVYRITRAPERRVFKVDVGNIDEADVPAYIDKITAKFKKSAVVNQSGGVDYRYNMLTNDEDYFIPVRGGTADTLIDTLPGAQNLSDIGDIEYIKNKLCAGLQIPKSFLGFDGESGGDGKNFSMQDIRFARTVNKIQQCMIMELNKVAIIHLYLLGFTDEINNFKLSLAKSSKQSELLENEILSAKLDNFAKAVQRIDGTYAPMSYTEASKRIFGKSDDEIILSIQQQFVEAHESSKLGEDYIKQNPIDTGIYSDIQKRYGLHDKVKQPTDDEEVDDSIGDVDFSGAPSGFGGGGGSPFSDDFSGDEFGNELGDSSPDDEFNDN